MAKSITPVATTQTFQNWLNKTNEMVAIFQSDAMTASVSGDTTTGDATLVGDFTASNLIADIDLSTDSISSKTASGTIAFNDPISVTGSTEVVTTFSFGSGPKTRYTNGTLAWDVGLDSTNFVIDTGVAPAKFSLSTAGTLTVPDLVVTGSITGAVDVNSDDITEGSTNLFYTDARVAAYVTKAYVDGLDVDADTLDGLDSTQFLRSDADDTYTGNLSIDGNIGSTGNIEIVGNLEAAGYILTNEVRSVGDIITKYSSSDLRLKENLQIINNALDKVTQVNGYTFNYKDTPDERVSGIVAQEIEKVLPEVVFDHERNNGTYKAVRYDNVIPLLLEAIKELKGKVDDLENRLGSGN